MPIALLDKCSSLGLGPKLGLPANGSTCKIWGGWHSSASAHLAGAGKQEAGMRPLGQSQHVHRTNEASLDGLDGIVPVRTATCEHKLADMSKFQEQYLERVLRMQISL
jgi:hypothetical protein